ncbi:MAG TPA: cytochrome P450 [Acidimicrobiales bacterium]|nr:cytochrome P450 [Acidimicrobiales bacterium]
MQPRQFGVDLIADPVAGDELHRALAWARAQPVPPEAVVLGMPARVIARFDALKTLFADHLSFPGGTSYKFMVEPAVGPTFISMDGDDHDRMRRLTTPAFRSQAVSQWIDDQLVPLAHEIVDRFAPEGRADLVVSFASVLPLWAISRKLGLPMGSEERQRAWTAALLSHPVNPAAAEAARREVLEFLAPIIAERRAGGGSDVLSHLMAHRDEGVGLSDDEIVNHIRLLYVVGAATTADGLSNLLFHVLRRPELVARARQGTQECERLVVEALRYEPPVAVLPRIIAEAGVVAGTELPAGSIALCAIAGANRDAEVFADPDRFDPDRDQRGTLTFGFGSKFCPGSYLARRQMTAALSVLVSRLPNLTVVEASEPVGGILRSCRRLVATWDAV